MPDKNFGLSVHLFTRDLRVDDNPALLAALESSESVITCFAAEKSLIRNSPENRLRFISESLKELAADIIERGGKLRYYSNGAVKLAEELCRDGAEAIFCTRDYTPYSLKRDILLERACKKAGCRYISLPGSLLNEPEDVLRNDGGYYSVFTPYFRKASSIPVYEPSECTCRNFSGEGFFEETGPQDLFYTDTASKINKPALMTPKGGRAEGKRLLKNTSRLKNYDNKRNIPAENGTTRLSAHLRFGTVSVREAYHTISKELSTDHGIIRQLYWRDFFTHIAFIHPQVFKNPFYSRFESLQWYDGDDLFELWCEGRTGFPFIDAGMREMNITGYMHNRVRMAAASFLVKDLHIDWRRGERYFASRLLDYDPSVNNGNWQWAASTGCDAQPYFRIFNPWLQQKRYDPECIYIKRWIPELADLAPEEIHSLNKRESETTGGYPPPVVDHKTEAMIAKKIYSETVKQINQQNLQ
ncbi:MAG: deoxyribodipyrimidine photo-lyase [Methanomicrobiaceae archaeon]|nr:deoxyribodipyrimidine photo-lyase [Methanomicrobiaceae archaeon]